MKTAKKLGLIVSAVVFCLSIFAITSNAQYNRNRQAQNRRVYSSSQIYQSQRNRRLSAQERHRLAIQRAQLYRARQRYSRDGVVTRREYRRYDRKSDRYRRNVRRDRRDW